MLFPSPKLYCTPRPLTLTLVFLIFPSPFPASKQLINFYQIFSARRGKSQPLFLVQLKCFFFQRSVLTVDVSRWTKSYKLYVMMLTVQCVCFFLIRWVFVLSTGALMVYCGARKMPSKKVETT